MAYGTQAKVLFYLGRSAVETSGYFTAANIALAIAAADIIVDEINDEASATNKTEASSQIAADMLWNNWAKALNEGALQVGGSEGFASRSYQEKAIPSANTRLLLAASGTVSYRTDAD